MRKNPPVLEIVTWKSKPNISDQAMIQACEGMVADLKTLSGFLHQSLYKEEDGTWFDVYYWETEKDAHDSNSSMADRDSFKNLIELIDPETVSIKIFDVLQSSGTLSFEQ